MHNLYRVWGLIILFSFHLPLKAQPATDSSRWQIHVLGVAQDAGYPQANCQKSCCQAYWNGEQEEQFATSIALTDLQQKKAWIFEATPNIKNQLQVLNQKGLSLEGIFITHAHIGHYTGLMHLGHEVMGARDIPVYAMPRMKTFLESNGPWSQLVTFGNIKLHELAHKEAVSIDNNVEVVPFLVPHRDEYSETVGYKIFGPDQSILFIPDINKWSVWKTDIREEIKNSSYALLDATFYNEAELPGRNIKDIPHPFIIESMTLFKGLDIKEKSKVHFIHMNHTNPVMFDTQERRSVLDKGFNVATMGQIIKL